MGSIYRRKWKDKEGNIHESETLGIKYYRDGRPMRESAETSKETEAKKLLKSREGDSVHGVQVTPRVTRVRFSELAEAVVNDYKMRKLKSLPDLQMRLRLHVLPAFGHHRAASITSDHIDDFILQRQEAGATNAEVNRELAIVRRAFLLAMKASPPEGVAEANHHDACREQHSRGFLRAPAVRGAARPSSRNAPPHLDLHVRHGLAQPK